MTVTVPLLATDLTIAFTRGDGTKLTIIDAWNLRGAPSNLHCIAGRSGSGKTSILRAIAGLLPPTSGQIHWWGDDLSTLPSAELRQRRRSRMGYVDQSASLIPELTVRENILLPVLPDGGRAVRKARPHADELIARLELQGRASHRPAALSGGERQRVALARALINEPEVLIADEPTASLDRQLADVVIEVLRELASNGLSVIVASHDPYVALAAAHVHRLEPPPAASISD